ncbi:hypothetical protein cand_036590 [Cryptosporidium andersoni]|uniref:Arf-GAP domain-containing protein n=1 Tax=Cryptosporidium andersoni TaxID=117008 RepID=A0A1J4MWZ0_9CRYT|nr:hypothetical protein cand_036590 [Cryptosporidium andersoni]
MSFLELGSATVDDKGYVMDKFRDDFFQKMRSKAENRTCFDCQSRNPSWVSISYAIFICLNCSSDHRKMGVHISFVRSADLDKFSPSQLLRMNIGGNLRARNYFKQIYGTQFSAKSRDYAISSFGSQYKQILDKEVNITLQISVPSEKSTSNDDSPCKGSNSCDTHNVDYLELDNKDSLNSVMNSSLKVRQYSAQTQRGLLIKGKRLDADFDFDLFISNTSK